MEFLSAADRDALRAEVRGKLREAIAEASRSADPVRAELGRALADGTLTPRQALAGSAYHELLRARVDNALRYLRATDEQRREIAEADATTGATPAPPTTPERRPTNEDAYFDDMRILRRP